MVELSLPLYQNEPETWDVKKCEKLARRHTADGLGTKCKFKGWLMGLTFGEVRYNGGCIREDKWYQGECFPFPKLPNGFKIVSKPTWGWVIVKTK
jgi:hypothetical protein